MNKAEELTNRGEKFATENFSTKDYQMIARRSYIEGATDQYKEDCSTIESISDKNNALIKEKMDAYAERDKAIQEAESAREDARKLTEELESEKRHKVEAGEYRFREYKKNVAARVANWVSRHDAQLTNGEIEELRNLIQNS